MSKEQTPTAPAVEPVVEPAAETAAETSKYVPREILNWEDLEAKMDLLRGIYAIGFETPSPIQKKAISPMFDKKDVIAQAQSGTGKTGCFAVASLQLTDATKSVPQVLILSPTRELAMQTQHVIDTISNQMKGIKTQLLIGGTSTEEDIRKLSENNPQIIIGCPGRVHDMMRRKRLHTNDLRLIVIDEADEMLSSGFKEQVYNIFQYMPNEIQVGLFSATMPIELNSLTEKFMRNPIKILVKAEQLTLEGIEQFYIALDSDDQKYDALKDLYGIISMSQCIIYCNSVKRVSDLYDAMTADNFPVCQIHSNMEKEDRNASYEAFKSGSQRVLISSNVTARGIDIQQVSTVVNFDVPKCIHTYLHRIGRSGRWGRKGIGINFVTRRDARNIKDVENHYSTQIKELPQSFVA